MSVSYRSLHIHFLIAGRSNLMLSRGSSSGVALVCDSRAQPSCLSDVGVVVGLRVNLTVSPGPLSDVGVSENR
eukprot:1393721-Amorphochlora_amoeboformis.AAC.2